LQRAEAQQLVATTQATSSQFAEIISSTLYDSIQRDAFLQLWKRSLDALTRAVLRPDVETEYVVPCLQSVLEVRP
jgi:hypothetical protein